MGFKASSLRTLRAIVKLYMLIKGLHGANA